MGLAWEILNLRRPKWKPGREQRHRWVHVDAAGGCGVVELIGLCKQLGTYASGGEKRTALLPGHMGSLCSLQVSAISCHSAKLLRHKVGRSLHDEVGRLLWLAQHW